MDAIACREMLRAYGYLIIAAAAVSSPYRVSAESASNGAPPHLAAAVDLVAHVAPQDTNYEHKRGSVVWGDAGQKYECHTDCSGLLNHLIQHVYHQSDSEFRAWLGTGRPTAKTYHDAIAAGHGFLRIEQIAAILPGDIIAIKYEPGGTNTGHTMLVAEPPRVHQPSEPIVRGTTQWEVVVIDSSMSGHGKTDTRRKPDGKYRDGLGRGVLRLYGNDRGTIAGYSWSTLTGSDFYPQSQRHVEVGRLRLH
ncbi:MAG TPA: hypothetical protein VG713_21030 [Pirellulales bacterium]|nr:hypothetical protein [Pirellulales bacterium]